MAEGLLRSIGGDRVEVYSAGTKPTAVRPEAVAVMAELGIDISDQRSKDLAEFDGQTFDDVITVCDNANERCPLFSGQTRRLHWSFPDPATVDGSPEEQLATFRSARDSMATRFRAFVSEEGLRNRRTGTSPTSV
jgi:arsenate reductase